MLLWFSHNVFKDNGKMSNSNFVLMNNNNTCRYFGIFLQNMNLMTFGHITTSLFVLAIVDVNAKSILINNSTVKIIVSENNSSNGIQTSVLMDRHTKTWRFHFKLRRRFKLLQIRFLNWRIKWNPNLHSAQKLKAKVCEDNKRWIYVPLKTFY